MNEQNRKRVIGALALVVVAVVVVWVIKLLATPAEAPNGESVRVYEILPNGQARAVKEGENNADGQQATGNSTGDNAEPGVKSAIAKPATKPAPPAQKPEPEPPAQTPESDKADREVLAPAADPDARPRPAADAPTKPVVSPAPKPVKPAPTPASQPEIASGDWLVQVGSFGKKSNADRVVEKLAPRFPARVRSAVVNGKTYYRVQTGPFASKTQAKSAEEKLQGEGYGARAMQSP